MIKRFFVFLFLFIQGTSCFCADLIPKDLTLDQKILWIKQQLPTKTTEKNEDVQKKQEELEELLNKLQDQNILEELLNKLQDQNILNDITGNELQDQNILNDITGKIKAALENVRHGSWDEFIVNTLEESLNKLGENRAKFEKKLIQFIYTDLVGSYSYLDFYRPKVTKLLQKLNQNVTEQELDTLKKIQNTASRWYELFFSGLDSGTVSSFGSILIEQFFQEHKETLQDPNCYLKQITLDKAIKQYLFDKELYLVKESAEGLTKHKNLLLQYRLVTPKFFEHIFEWFLYLVISDGYIFNTKYPNTSGHESWKKMKRNVSKKQFLKIVDIMVKYFCDNNFCKAYDRYRWLIIDWEKGWTEPELKKMKESSALPTNYFGTGGVNTNGIRFGHDFLGKDDFFGKGGNPFIVGRINLDIRKEHGEFLLTYLYYKCHPAYWWSTHVGVPGAILGILSFILYKKYQKGILSNLKTFMKLKK